MARPEGGLTMISIRALLAEGDSFSAANVIKALDFNPRPPCGGRPFHVDISALKYRFQSAPSLRRATIAALTDATVILFQSAPSLRRATL